MHKRINWALALIITVSALTSLASVETDKSIKIDPSFYNNIIRISLLRKYFKKWVIYKTKF